MKSRGNALLVILTVLTGLAATAAAVSLRLDSDSAFRDADERRAQALWLARSAAVQGVARATELSTPEGEALLTVSVKRTPRGTEVVAQAAMAGGTARVEALLGPDRAVRAWEETYGEAAGLVASPK